jgi:DNA-binding transcriptional LysR family regulator
MVISASEFSDGCQSEFIGNHRVYLIVPAGHPLASRESVSVSDFCDEKIIAIDINSNLDTHVKNMFKAEDVRPDMTYVSDWTAQHLTVAAGGGVGLSVGVPHNHRSVRMIPVDHPEALMPLYLSWATGRKLTPAASYVKDKILEITRSMIAMGEAF